MFKKQLMKVLATLKLVDKAKAQSLSSEDIAQIAATYKEEYGEDLEADAKKFKNEADKAAAFDRLKSQIESIDLSAEDDSGEEDNTNEDPDDDGADAGGEGVTAVEKKVTKIVASNKQLKTKVNTMRSQALPDTPEAIGKVALVGFGGTHTATHCFGIDHPFYAAEKRWNKVAIHGRAYAQLNEPSEKDFEDFKAEVKAYGLRVSTRMQELHSQGLLNKELLSADSTIDYSNLKLAGLGEQYLVRREDALIGRILSLPNVFGVFPRRSNIQDGELITNAFLGEFSQAYQEGERSKGGMSLEPEKAKVHDVMFKYLIPSFKWIEASYLGYKNINGSDPIKWNMIEWMLLEIAKVLQNEQNRRYVQGCRVEPVAGVNSHYLFASTGVIHRLISYIENFQTLPYADEDLNTYTQANIGDMFEAFAAEVSEVLDSFAGKAIYANEKHKPWYTAWYRNKYGKDIDFAGSQFKLLNYDLPIIWVPNMGSSMFVWITDIGNIQTLENVPGEMFNTKFQQNLESVWAWSTWKEGTVGGYAGRKFATLAALVENGRKDQAIFINYPVKVLAADATTCDAKENFLFKTAANTGATALTDITDAQEGVVYKVEIGSADNATTIAKAGKFSEISEAFTAGTVGSWIKLIYNKTTGKFKDVERFVVAE